MPAARPRPKSSGERRPRIRTDCSADCSARRSCASIRGPPSAQLPELAGDADSACSLNSARRSCGSIDGSRLHQQRQPPLAIRPRGRLRRDRFADACFPNFLATAGLKLCKLQMLKTQPQAGGWQTGPAPGQRADAAALSEFRDLPQPAALAARIARETPELDRFGIHVMASQNDAGEVILGDSHEYDADIRAVRQDADRRPDPARAAQDPSAARLDHRRAWHGVYAKHPALPAVEAEPLPDVHICTGTGGAGMTMAFGLAERAWQRWL